MSLIRISVFLFFLFQIFNVYAENLSAFNVITNSTYNNLNIARDTCLADLESPDFQNTLSFSYYCIWLQQSALLPVFEDRIYTVNVVAWYMVRVPLPDPDVVGTSERVTPGNPDLYNGLRVANWFKVYRAWPDDCGGLGTGFFAYKNKYQGMCDIDCSKKQGSQYWSTTLNEQVPVERFSHIDASLKSCSPPTLHNVSCVVSFSYIDNNIISNVYRELQVSAVYNNSGGAVLCSTPFNELFLSAVFNNYYYTGKTVIDSPRWHNIYRCDITSPDYPDCSLSSAGDGDGDGDSGDGDGDGDGDSGDGDGDGDGDSGDGDGDGQGGKDCSNGDFGDLCDTWSAPAVSGVYPDVSQDLTAAKSNFSNEFNNIKNSILNSLNLSFLSSTYDCGEGIEYLGQRIRFCFDFLFPFLHIVGFGLLFVCAWQAVQIVLE